MATSSGSNREGVTSWKETKRGIVSRQQLVRWEAHGAAKGLAHILKEASKRRLVLSTSFILRLHKFCFGAIFDWAGKFRTIEVEVSAHIPPKFYDVPVLMHNFFEDLNVRLAHITPADVNREQYIREVIEVVVWAQHRFLWIHPLQDYNGRMARLLSNLILAHFRLPLLRLDLSDKTIRRRYIRALQKADEYDYSDLTLVILEMLGVDK